MEKAHNSKFSETVSYRELELVRRLVDKTLSLTTNSNVYKDIKFKEEAIVAPLQTFAT